MIIKSGWNMTGRWLTGFALALSFCFCGQANADPQNGLRDSVPRVANDDLQKWIGGNLHFFPNEAGIPKLFLRRQPVRVGILANPDVSRDEILRPVARLSNAVGVQYEISKSDVNLVIVVQPQINDGDKPEIGLWKRAGLSQKMYEIVAAQAKWDSGCGIYSFGVKGGGEVPLSIVFADSRLEPAQVNSCITEGVIRAFGLRAHRTQILRSDDGYLQYVALARALSICERKLGVDRILSMNESDQRASYAGCAADLLGSTSSLPQFP